MSGSKFFKSSNTLVNAAAQDDINSFSSPPPPSSSSSSSSASFSSNIHRLPETWCLWHHFNQGKMKYPQSVVPIVSPEESDKDNNSSAADNENGKLDKYLQNTNLLSFPKIEDLSIGETTDIDSAEQMWQVFSNLEKFSSLKVGNDLMLFKSGIKPIWEDPINLKGGRWIFKFSKKSASNSNSAVERRRTNLIWERLIIKLLSGNFINEDNLFKSYLEDDIAGIVLSIRKDEDMISIWNKNSFMKSYSKDLNDLQVKLSLKLQKTMNELENEIENGNFTSDHDLSSDPIDINQESGEKLSNIEDSLKNQVVLTPFIGRRGISDSMVKIVKESNSILANNDDIINPVIVGYTQDANYNSSESIEQQQTQSIDNYKVKGFISIYRLHSDTSSAPTNSSMSSSSSTNNHSGKNHSHSHHSNKHYNENGHSNTSKYPNQRTRTRYNNNNGSSHNNHRSDDFETVGGESSSSPPSSSYSDQFNSRGKFNGKQNSVGMNSRRKYNNGNNVAIASHTGIAGNVTTNATTGNGNGNATNGAMINNNGSINGSEGNGSSDINSSEISFSNLGISRKELDLDVNGDSSRSVVDDGEGLLNFSSRRRRLQQRNSS